MSGSIWRLCFSNVVSGYSKCICEFVEKCWKVCSTLEPRSHIACNRSATSLRPKYRGSQGGCRLVARSRRPLAEGCRDDLVARRFWLMQVKPLCDQIDRRKVFGGRRQVADRSPTGWRLIADQLQRLQTIPTQLLVADLSPIGCQPISKKLQGFCNQKQTLKIQSPTSRRPIANRLPNAPQLIADWLPTDRRRVDNHCPITRYYSINTRSLSAPEPMLDLFSVSSNDINLKAISWRQFYKRYFKHRSLKLTWKLLIWYFFQIKL